MTSHSSERGAPNAALFVGVRQLYDLVGLLYQRPRIGNRPRELAKGDPSHWGAGFKNRAERSGRRGLPMVCVVRPPARQQLLQNVQQSLLGAQPDGVRNALIDLDDCAAGKSDVEGVRNVLWEAAERLTENPRVAGRKLQFRLYPLAAWLTRERASSDRELLVSIKNRGLVGRFRRGLDQVWDEMPDSGGWRSVLAILRAVTWISFRLAVTGRVPALSGRYRWFLKQPHLAPEMSGSFPRFARRLTDGEWKQESPEFVKRLLVNAFLEDLREAYRFRFWQVWRRHRTTFPALLLDNVAKDNCGFEVLRLINEVRNQVGVFDPLLVISAGTTTPRDADRHDPNRLTYKARESTAAYQAWQKALWDARRMRRESTWYLVLWVGDEAADREAEAWQEGFNGFRVVGKAARTPWWATRWTRAGVPAAITALVAALLVIQGDRDKQSHCETDLTSLVWTGTECVGISDGSYNLFQPSDDSMSGVMETIHQQNQRAEELHQLAPERPYISIVALQALTSSSSTVNGLTAERESLEGFAVAQLRQLETPTAAEPIVRVLIANGGKGMREGVRVANLLGGLAKQDRSIVGVVGLNMSNNATQNTIAALTGAGLPTVASTLSADSLADNNPMYFQVAPQNRREAAVVAAFVDQLDARPRSVRIYYSDDDSYIYSTNLRDDAVAAFEARKFRVDARAFTSSGSVDAPAAHDRYGDVLVGNAAAAGRDTCSFDGYVFFAGGGNPAFGEFAGGAAQCGSNAVFIGGDDVTRHVADEVARQHNRALPYYYVSFATAPLTPPNGMARDFYTTLNDLFPFERTERGRSLDGHAALAFDAAQVIITATNYLSETSTAVPVTPGTVWREITAIHTSRPGSRQVNKHIDGVTGTIDYGGDIHRNVPRDKPVAILRVSDGEVDTSQLAFCGQADGLVPETWCPPSN